MLGHHRHASETPFKWRFAGEPMMACLLWHLDSPLVNQNKKQKNVVIVAPPPSDKTLWIRA